LLLRVNGLYDIGPIAYRFHCRQNDQDWLTNLYGSTQQPQIGE